MIVYIENPIVSTKNLLDLINEFSIVVGYKVNIQKLMYFHTPVMNYQKDKLRKQYYLLVEQQKNKIPRDKFNHVGNLYSENYRIMKKEIEEHTNKWKHIPCS